MTRYQLTIEYDGGPYVGWQIQANGVSVQARLGEAVYRFCGERGKVEGAGRTDAGVHALGQAAHLDLSRDVPADTLRAAMNFYLRCEPITVLAARKVASDFHARFTAIGRRYLYRVLDRRGPPTVTAGRVWHQHVPLDVPAMQEGAAHLIGSHDFTSFRASACQARSPCKTLDRLTVDRVGDEIHIRAEARSFLHHQVRNMVGTLTLVGRGKWTAQDVAKALQARDRRAGGPTAAPEGLYLVAVIYPPEEAQGAVLVV